MNDRLPVVALVWLAIGVVAWFGFVASERALIGGFALFVATIPLLGLGRAKFRWFNPLILVTVPAIVGVGLRSWYLLYAEERPGARRLLIDSAPGEVVMLGAIVLGIGLGALVLGYLSCRERTTTRRADTGEWRLPWDWTNLALIVALVIGIAATLLYFRAVGGVSLDALSSKRYIELEGGATSSGAFYSRAAAVPAITALALIAAWSRGLSVPPFTRLLVGLCLLTSLVAPFVASSRAEIIALLAMAAIAWSVARPSFSIRVVGVGIVLLFIFLLMGSLRCEHQTGSGDGCSVASQVEESLLANESWMSVSKTAHIYDKVPGTVPYEGGSTFVAGLLAPVPRVLWAEKPAVRSGGLVAFEILELPSNRQTGAPPGIVGELFLNWGWPGVVGGMFLIGWLLRRLWDWHQRNHGDFAVAAFALVVTHTALRLPGGDFAGTFWPIVQGLLVLAVLLVAGSLIAGARRGPRSVTPIPAEVAR